MFCFSLFRRFSPFFHEGGAAAGRKQSREATTGAKQPKKKGENRMMIDYSQIDVFVFLFCSSSPYEDVFLEYTDR
jgi:hypothetical protein